MIKSYKFWVGIAGSIGLFLTAISDTFGISINVAGVKEIIMTLCGVLITIGIVQKPKTEDDKQVLASKSNKEQEQISKEEEKLN